MEEHIPKAIPKTIQDALLKALGKGEISNIHLNFYDSSSPHDFFQGNCLDNAMFINLPSKHIDKHPVLIISNPCDTDVENIHKRTPRITYCAVKKLSSFQEALKRYSDMNDDEIKAYINNVKEQYVSDIVYLPMGSGISEERIAILSQLVSCDLQSLIKSSPNVTSRLAQKAYYLLLTKLSIHFLRFGDITQAQ